MGGLGQHGFGAAAGQAAQVAGAPAHSKTCCRTVYIVTLNPPGSGSAAGRSTQCARGAGCSRGPRGAPGGRRLTPGAGAGGRGGGRQGPEGRVGKQMWCGPGAMERDFTCRAECCTSTSFTSFFPIGGVPDARRSISVLQQSKSRDNTNCFALHAVRTGLSHLAEVYPEHLGQPAEGAPRCREVGVQRGGVTLLAWGPQEYASNKQRRRTSPYAV